MKDITERSCNARRGGHALEQPRRRAPSMGFRQPGPARSGGSRARTCPPTPAPRRASPSAALVASHGARSAAANESNAFALESSMASLSLGRFLSCGGPDVGGPEDVHVLLPLGRPRAQPLLQLRDPAPGLGADLLARAAPSLSPPSPNPCCEREKEREKERENITHTHIHTHAHTHTRTHARARTHTHTHTLDSVDAGQTAARSAAPAPRGQAAHQHDVYDARAPKSLRSRAHPVPNAVHVRVLWQQVCLVHREHDRVVSYRRGAAPAQSARRHSPDRIHSPGSFRQSTPYVDCASGISCVRTRSCTSVIPTGSLFSERGGAPTMSVRSGRKVPWKSKISTT